MSDDSAPVFDESGVTGDASQQLLEDSSASALFASAYDAMAATPSQPEQLGASAAAAAMIDGFELIPTPKLQPGSGGAEGGRNSSQGGEATPSGGPQDPVSTAPEEPRGLNKPAKNDSVKGLAKPGVYKP